MQNRTPFLLIAAMITTGVALSACSGTQPSKPGKEGNPAAVALSPAPVEEMAAVGQTDPAEAPSAATLPGGAMPAPLLQADEAQQAVVEPAAEETLPTRYVFSFKTNSASLSESDYEEIKRHADYLVSHPDAMITIAGHADIRGPKALNEKLARARAEAVALALMENGVSEAQILVTSHGEEVPVINENNWQENRRAEIEYIDDYRLSSRQAGEAAN